MNQDLIKMVTKSPAGRFLSFISTSSLSGGEKRRATGNLLQEIRKVVAGMANSDGGIVVIGMEEGGNVTDTSHIRWDEREWTKRFSKGIDPPPPVKVIKEKVKGGEVVVVEVEKSYDIHTLKGGRIPFRSGFWTHTLTGEMAEGLLMKKVEGSYEEKIVEKATLKDLNLSLLQRFKILSGEDRNPATLLSERYRLLFPHGGTYRVSAGALLLFAEDSLRWAPQSSLEIVKFSGKREEAEGEEFNVEARMRFDLPIFSMIENSLRKVEEIIKDKIIPKDLFFTGVYTFPKIIWKEALLNAIVHRDYRIQCPVRVFIYDDMMEITNPGSPSPFISEALDEARGLERLSFFRNPIMTRVLSDCGFIKGIGEGFLKISRAVRKEKLLIPEIRMTGNSFSISIPLTPVLNEDLKGYIKRWKGLPFTSRDITIIGFALSHSRRFSTRDIKEMTGVTSPEAYYIARRMVEMGVAIQERGKFSRVYALKEPGDMKEGEREGEAGSLEEGDKE